MGVKRLDATTLGEHARTPQGGLRVAAYPTRAGVFRYLQSDGRERYELRPPQEVFALESLESLKFASVTDLHPTAPVNPDNYKALTVGVVADDVRADSPFVAATLLIQDAENIRKVETGEHKELSCGYSCDLIEQSGVFEGQQYDAIQTRIRYNHVALGPVGWGRGGPEVALRTDDNQAVLPAPTPAQPNKTTEDVKRVDALEAENKDLRAKLAEAEAKFAAEKNRADQASDPKRIHKLAVERAALLDHARSILGTRFDEDGASEMDDLGMMREMLGIMAPDVSVEGASDDFVRGAFKFALTHAAKTLGEPDGDEYETDEGGSREGEGEYEGSPSGQAQPAPAGDMTKRAMGGRSDSHFRARAGNATRDDSSDEDSVDAARERSRNDSRNAWKTPLHATKDG